MKKVLLLLISILSLLIIVSCALPSSEMQYKPIHNVVSVVIGDNGISVDASEVVVSNFHSGSRAEMTYRIYNTTSKIAQPSIYWVDADIASYSKANGAVKAASEVREWLELPSMEEIQPVSAKDYIVILKMPEEAKKTDNKIGFQLGVCNNNDDKVQTGVGTWWIINMR